MSDLDWPDAPVCHTGDSARSEFLVWRPSRTRRDHAEPYSEPYRTCGYCGSIHPEDLYRAMMRHPSPDFRITGSDWKYGWPHKFYVDGIPNLAAGEPVGTYAYGNREVLELNYPGCPIERREGRKSRMLGMVEPTTWRVQVDEHNAPIYVHAKWYNIHLIDLTPVTFEVFAAVLQSHHDVRWTKNEDGRLMWQAIPGYQ